MPSIEEKAAARKNLNWKVRVPDLAIDKAIGKKLRAIRKAHYVSQVELAGVLGYESTVAISLIESGDRSIPAYRLVRIAKFFGLPITEFTP